MHPKEGAGHYSSVGQNEHNTGTTNGNSMTSAIFNEDLPKNRLYFSISLEKKSIL